MHRLHMVDQALFHQLRSRGRVLAQGLLLVLLATWLAAVCPHCLAQAEAVAPADVSDHAMHCHGDQAQSSPAANPAADVGFDTFDHGACPQAPVCTGGDCPQLTALDPGTPLDVLPADVPAPASVAADFLSFAWPSTPPPARTAVPVLAAADCPLYLRHCSFLN